MKNRDSALTQHYVEKADHFFQAMKLLSDDMPAYSSSVGLLAIHSSISHNDAIAVGVTGKRSKSEDHMGAAQDLEKLCKANKVTDRKGVQHLSWLLARKTNVAYGEKRLERNELLLARDKAERFQAWAYNIFQRSASWLKCDREFWKEGARTRSLSFFHKS